MCESTNAGDTFESVKPTLKFVSEVKLKYNYNFLKYIIWNFIGIISKLF